MSALFLGTTSTTKATGLGRQRSPVSHQLLEKEEAGKKERRRGRRCSWDAVQIQEVLRVEEQPLCLPPDTGRTVHVTLPFL